MSTSDFSMSSFKDKHDKEWSLMKEDLNKMQKDIEENKSNYPDSVLEDMKELIKSINDIDNMMNRIKEKT